MNNNVTVLLPETPDTRNGLIQIIRTGKSTGLERVNNQVMEETDISL